MLDYYFRAIEIPRWNNLPPIMMIPTQDPGQTDEIIFVDPQRILSYARAKLEGIIPSFKATSIETSIKQAVKAPDFEHQPSRHPLSIPVAQNKDEHPVTLKLHEWKLITRLAEHSLIFIPLQVRGYISPYTRKLIELEDIQPIPTTHLRIPREKRVRRMVNAYRQRPDTAQLSVAGL